MTDNKHNPHSPEEIAKAAQEAAIKAAMEQAQAMFGNIPGFQMPDMGAMQEQINAQMKAAVPDLEDIQSRQAAMGTLGGVDAATVAAAAAQNMAYASDAMASMMNGMPEELSDLFDEFADSDWDIRRKDDGSLSSEQLRLLAFGAPLLVYNSECVDAIESDFDADTFREQLNSWWNITDRRSALEIVEWLISEGHHSDADEALTEMLERGIGNIADEERQSDESKMGDVCLIAENMLENGYCTPDNLPCTAIAWDLVRVTNLARWAYLCGYFSREDMWEVMKVSADLAMSNFSSWEEYGLSFAFGRGVWHGDPDDCDTAFEIVRTLLDKEESPWRQINW